MTITTSHTFFPILKKLIPNIPEFSTQIRIDIPLDDAVRVAVEFFADINQDKVKEVHYYLCPADSKDNNEWKQYAEFLKAAYLDIPIDHRSLEQLIADCQRSLRETKTIIEKISSIRAGLGIKPKPYFIIGEPCWRGVKVGEVIEIVL